jgi:gamma-butyrobetaine dioxygenase
MIYSLCSLRPLAGLRGFASSASAVTADGVSYKGVTYPLRWLRDSCQCPKCIHPSTRQKLHRTSEIPIDVKPSKDGLNIANDGIHIAWDNEHTSFFPSDFLERYTSRARRLEFHRHISQISWDKARIQSVPTLSMKYEDLREPSGLLTALTQLTRYGLLFVTGVSPQETSNEKCEARRLGQLFAEIRETFYGQTWDVINVRNSTNIAYTNLNLGLHMDLL